MHDSETLDHVSAFLAALREEMTVFGLDRIQLRSQLFAKTAAELPSNSISKNFKDHDFDHAISLAYVCGMVQHLSPDMRESRITITQRQIDEIRAQYPNFSEARAFAKAYLQYRRYI